MAFSDRIDARVSDCAFGRASRWFKRRPINLGAWNALWGGVFLFLFFRAMDRIGPGEPTPWHLCVVLALITGISSGSRAAWELRKERIPSQPSNPT